MFLLSLEQWVWGEAWGDSEATQDVPYSQGPEEDSLVACLMCPDGGRWDVLGEP